MRCEMPTCFPAAKHQQAAAMDICVDSARPWCRSVLEHLHHELLAFAEDALDRSGPLAATVAVALLAPDVGDVQEGGALQADVHEGRLHARQHPRHPAEIDVADNAATIGALDVQFLDDTLLQERHAGFLRREVDQEFFHCRLARCRRQPG
jgi:hypothetical protein